jgi:hypothetical protein
MDTFLLIVLMVLSALVIRWLRQLRHEPPPGSLGALVASQGVDWGTLARSATVREFADGLENCRQCAAKAECGSWLASGQREGYQRFCPNARFVERVAERAAR